MVKWQDFDFDGKVKIPLGFYFMLIYLLRGYITWVLSLTYREDTSLLLSLAYTESRFFYLALVTGLPAVLVQLLFSLKKQKTKSWYISLWLKSPWILAVALVADIILQIKQVVLNGGIAHGVQMLLLFAGVYLLWYWVKSQKIKRFFSNWLIPMEQKVDKSEKAKS